MPIIDWRAVRKLAPVEASDDVLNGFFWGSALTWLEAMRDHLGAGYNIAQSDSFVMLSSLTSRERELALQFCERSRKRILKSLQGVAEPWGHGPHVVFIFETLDEYYDYVGNYFPSDGEFSLSSGMFIQHGYGHFVFVRRDLHAVEPIIVHEMTHCMLAALDLPAWLNEGTAVGMEKHLIPHMADARGALYSPKELAQKHKAFWNEETIQQFWSGKSFLNAGDGNSLSYDLAEQITRLISREYEPYAAFMKSARRSDAGMAAALSIFGFGLGHVAAALLGEGSWEPDPTLWREGTEGGQFYRGAVKSSGEPQISGCI